MSLILVSSRNSRVKILLYWRWIKMKVRLGFVTNSSSSSFAAIGLWVSKKNLTDEFCLNVFPLFIKSDKNRWGLDLAQAEAMTPEQKINYIRDKGIGEVLETVLWGIETNLSYSSCGFWDDSKAVGINIDTFLEKYPDIKVSEMNKVALAEIQKIFPEADTVSYIQEGWNDI
jgi:hypothetical protein